MSTGNRVKDLHTTSGFGRFTVALVLSVPLVGSTLAATAGGSAREAPQCWAPEAFLGRASDKTIVKGTPKAIVPPPEDALAPFAPARTGAIRRVELPADMKKVALTFDLCEQPYEIAGYDAEIINLLRKESARATFFGGGKWMMTHSDKAQQLIADPLFEMGNHSWEHRNLRLLEGRRLTDEIGWAQAAYERQVGALAERKCLARDGKPFARTGANARMGLFRFPFGACNPAALDAVAKLGLLPIQWDVSSGDPTKTLTPAAMAAAVLRQVRPGSIVLFHANGRGWSTAAALAILIPQLRAKGYELATVGDLLATRGATWKTEPICYDLRPGDVDRHDALARQLDAAYQRFYAKAAPQAGAVAKPPAPPRAATTPPGSAARPAPTPDDGIPPPF